MDIKTIAFTLLLFRIVATLFISLVLIQQVKLLRQHRGGEDSGLRKILVTLSTVIFLGQFVPIIIDSLTLFSDVQRSKPTTIGVMYAYSNATTAAFASFLLWVIYRVAAKSQVRLKREHDVLHKCLDDDKSKKKQK